MFCSNCGGNINEDARFCTVCGKTTGNVPGDPVVPQQPINAKDNVKDYPQGYIAKDWLTALLLCIFLAAHRVYVGKISSGIIMILMWVIGYITIAFFIGIPILIGYLVWWIIDLVAICNGEFLDNNGYPLLKK